MWSDWRSGGKHSCDLCPCAALGLTRGCFLVPHPVLRHATLHHAAARWTTPLIGAASLQDLCGSKQYERVVPAYTDKGRAVNGRTRPAARRYRTPPNPSATLRHATLRYATLHQATPRQAEPLQQAKPPTTAPATKRDRMRVENSCVWDPISLGLLS